MGRLSRASSGWNIVSRSAGRRFPPRWRPHPFRFLARAVGDVPVLAACRICPPHPGLSGPCLPGGPGGHGTLDGRAFPAGPEAFRVPGPYGKSLGGPGLLAFPRIFRGGQGASGKLQRLHGGRSTCPGRRGAEPPGLFACRVSGVRRHRSIPRRCWESRVRAAGLSSSSRHAVCLPAFAGPPSGAAVDGKGGGGGALGTAELKTSGTELGI
jgi:hypothetical protein